MRYFLVPILIWVLWKANIEMVKASDRRDSFFREYEKKQMPTDKRNPNETKLLRNNKKLPVRKMLRWPEKR